MLLRHFTIAYFAILVVITTNAYAQTFGIGVIDTIQKTSSIVVQKKSEYRHQKVDLMLIRVSGYNYVEKIISSDDAETTISTINLPCGRYRLFAISASGVIDNRHTFWICNN